MGSGFLYFLPGGRRDVKIADVPAIAYAFERSIISREVLGAGPDGGIGVVIADASVPAESLGYYADSQTWRKIPNCEHWVGRDGGVITPKDLQRTKMLGGHAVTMADGNQWIVPTVIVRKATEDGWPGEMALPRAIGMDDAGNWTRGDVLPKYAALPDICSQWWESLIGSVVAAVNRDECGEPREAVGVKFVDWFNSVAKILQANYRISGVEVAMLGILDEQCASEVMNAAVDWPTMLEYLGKKASASAA